MVRVENSEVLRAPKQVVTDMLEKQITCFEYQLLFKRIALGLEIVLCRSLSRPREVSSGSWLPPNYAFCCRLLLYPAKVV